MAETIAVPLEFMHAVAHLQLPSYTNRTLQELMDRNTNGTLNSDHQLQLESLVEWSESLSLLRGQALHLLGERPT